MLSRLFGRIEAYETKNWRQSSKDEIKEICFARAFVKGKHMAAQLIPPQGLFLSISM